VVREVDAAARVRHQLSLFVPPEASGPFEAVRRAVDPVQHRLIPAHVTLCREDELEALDGERLRARLASAPTGAIRLRFGAPSRFHEHGILLPCVAGEEAFQQLRTHVLGEAGARKQEPHLTLAHPRNPKAPGNSLEAASSLAHALDLEFPVASLIRQEGNGVWQVLEAYRIGRPLG
jgi:hypothetical protein